MNRSGSHPAASAYRWMIASGFCAIATFTVVVGYYLPTYREAARLRSEHQTLAAERAAASASIEQLQTQLTQSQAQSAALARELESAKGDGAKVRDRIEKLDRLLSAQFGRLAREKMLVVSSASDRVSVALAVPALFSSRERLTPNGRELLCQLSKVIMSEFKGQIRVTGYYGKPQLDPASARRRTPWHLAAERAASAADALERDCNGPADRFLVVSYGPRAAGPLGENVALEFIFRPEDAISSSESARVGAPARK
jgi:flagellar motor protein MotB